MTGIYRWKINGITVNPIYKSDVTKDVEQETGQMFFREKLSGKLTFKGSDYVYLDSQAFDTNFILICERFYENVWTTYFTGIFTKTDCTWDIDHYLVEATINVYDNYNKILTGQEKEYDLLNPTQIVSAEGSIYVSLNPDLTPVSLDKRPLIQVYSPGSSVVSCFIGGVYWEQSVANEITNEGDLVSIYKFALASNMIQANLVKSGDHSPASGVYFGRNDGEIVKDNYKLSWIDVLNPSSPFEHLYYIYNITRISDNVILFTSGHYSDLVTTGDILFTEVATGIQNMTATLQSSHIYMRLLLDVDMLNGSATFNIPENDILSNNRNYKKVYPYAYDSCVISPNITITPTAYGCTGAKDQNGKPYYFDIPSGSYKYYPIARSTWINTSIWFYYPPFYYLTEEAGRKEYRIRDSYKISDVIKALLRVIDPTIIHENSIDYSEFLYDQSGNPIFGNWFELMITPKSNLINGQYDQPAQKAPITLKQIFDMLRDVCKCYWFIDVIDGVKMLKIEHIKYFKRSQSYTENPGQNVDLTILQDSRNNLSWGFGKNKITYDKEDLSETIQFEWMDKVSKSFEGFPIYIVSNYITKGKIDSVNVSGFTTDVDYMLTNPEAISQDGYVLFGAQIIDGKYKLPYYQYILSGADLTIQNGLLSWLYLHPNFYTYDLPASYVYINNTYSMVHGIDRKKKHEIKYPSDTDPNPLLLIITSIGNGQIEKFNVNLTTRMITVTLKYDTEIIES